MNYGQLNSIATDCMASEDANVLERHRCAGARARQLEAATTKSSSAFYASEEARALLAAVEAFEHSVGIVGMTTAERLLVAAIIAARANGGELPARPTRLLVALEGGVISGLVADVPGVEVVCLDYDTEGADAQDLFAIPQRDDGSAEAWRRLETAEVDPAFIDGARAARPSDPEARLAMLRREAAGMTESARRNAWGRALLAELEALEGEPYAYAATLARYDEGELNDEQTIAELQRNGWSEKRAYTILEEHQAA